MTHLAFFSAPTIVGISVRQDAQGRYCLNDLHRAAGGEPRHQPSNFFSLQTTQELVSVLDADLAKSQILTPGMSGVKTSVEIKAGRYGGTYVHRLLVLAYAAWISAEFNFLVLKTFDSVALAKQVRADSVLSFKELSSVVNKQHLALKGTPAKAHHFMVETQMVLKLGLGQSKKEFCEQQGIEPHQFRDWLAMNDPYALEKICYLEQADKFLVGLKMSYEERKAKLAEFLDTQFESKLPPRPTVQQELLT